MLEGTSVNKEGTEKGKKDDQEHKIACLLSKNSQSTLCFILEKINSCLFSAIKGNRTQMLWTV